MASIFDNKVVELIQNLGAMLLVVFYVSVVLWTYKDARRRIDDPILVATSVATSMLPIIGVFVYMMLRPPEYLADVRERELEIRAMERQLGRSERCPYCRSSVESDWLSCAVCTTRLRTACEGCDRPLDPRWAMCPYCELEVSKNNRSGNKKGGGSSDRKRNRSERPDATTVFSADTKTGAEAEDKKRKSSGDDGDVIRTEPFQSSTGGRFERGSKNRSSKKSDKPVKSPLA